MKPITITIRGLGACAACAMGGAAAAYGHGRWVRCAPGAAGMHGGGAAGLVALTQTPRARIIVRKCAASSRAW